MILWTKRFYLVIKLPTSWNTIKGGGDGNIPPLISHFVLALKQNKCKYININHKTYNDIKFKTLIYMNLYIFFALYA